MTIVAVNSGGNTPNSVEPLSREDTFVFYAAQRDASSLNEIVVTKVSDVTSPTLFSEDGSVGDDDFDGLAVDPTDPNVWDLRPR